MSSSASHSSPSTAAASPIDGTWRLKKNGFEKWSQDFVKTEETWAKDRWVWTFDTSNSWFEAKWQNPDGSWRDAWYGPLTVEGDTLTLNDAAAHTIDTFTWKVAGDGLRLTYVKTEGPQYVKGIPEAAYIAAYLSDLLVRGTCPPAAKPCS